MVLPLLSHSEARVFLGALDLEFEGSFAFLILGIQVKGGLERGQGNRVVEVFILVEPLHSQVVLVGLLESRVDWSQILQTALRRNEFMSDVVRGIVKLGEAKGQPSLLDLRVRVISHAEVGIDQSDSGKGDIILLLEKGRVEDGLEV